MADGEAVRSEAAPAQGDEKLGKAASDAGDDWVEKLREACEPDRHWRYRREFLLRNREALGGKEGEDNAELRRLASFSMVWANHVFLGCRYPPQVMEKVMDMAAGITVTNAPTHTLRDELVAKVKRGISSSNEERGEPSKKRAVGTDKPSPISSSGAKSTKRDVSVEKHKVPMKDQGKEAAKNLEKSQSPDVVQKLAPVASPSVAQKVASLVSPSVAQKVAPVASSSVAQKVAPVASSTGVRIEAGNANYESTTTTRLQAPVASSLPGSGSKMNYCSNRSLESNSEKVLSSENKNTSEDTAVVASKGGSHTSVTPAKVPCKLLTSEDAKERQPFFNRLYKAVAWKLVAVGGFSPSVNHVELLSSSIQSVKATLDVEFVPLKELADLPQNKSSQENVVCELRCKSVYLGTGCGKSKENAKAVASREALKLFLKKKVIVKLCKRKYKGKEIEDLVLLDEESKPLNLPPALRNPQEIL